MEGDSNGSPFFIFGKKAMSIDPKNTFPVYSIVRDSDNVIRFLDSDGNYAFAVGDRAEVVADRNSQCFRVFSTLHGVSPFDFNIKEFNSVDLDGVVTSYATPSVYGSDPLNQQLKFNDLYKQLADDVFFKCCGGGGGGGGGAVDSVFGRTGDVLAVASDYDASQVDNDSGVAGATVADALDNLEAAIPTGGGKWSLSKSGKFLAGNTSRYYMGNGTNGGEDGNFTSFLSGVASCDADHLWEGGFIVPFELANVGFKCTAWSDATASSITVYLLKGTRPSDDTAPGASIALTTVASAVAHSMPTSGNLYEVDRVGSVGVLPSEFLIIAFAAGVVVNNYYVKYTIYGDIV